MNRNDEVMRIVLRYAQFVLEVEVEYVPEEPATRDDPGFQDDLAVLKVFHNGGDIYDLLDQGTLDEIGDIAIAQVRAMQREVA